MSDEELCAHIKQRIIMIDTPEYNAALAERQFRKDKKERCDLIFKIATLLLAFIALIVAFITLN
ncbi:MAG: hypothetical protein KKE05_03555 [Nanoarchaeota archaeon]|nr:hypothetical protein [Nanoarchaeota archaeon]